MLSMRIKLDKELIEKDAFIITTNYLYTFRIRLKPWARKPGLTIIIICIATYTIGFIIRRAMKWSDLSLAQDDRLVRQILSALGIDF